MTHIPGGVVGGKPPVILKTSTSGNNPVLVWPIDLSQPWPARSTFRALVSAVETTLFAANAHRHFEIIGTMQFTSEMNQIVTSTEVAAEGIAALDAATAIFVLNGVSPNGNPAIQLTGIGGLDIDWTIELETLENTK